MINFALKIVMAVIAVGYSVAPAFAGINPIPRVPEPASVGLFVTGAAAVIYLRHRRRK